MIGTSALLGTSCCCCPLLGAAATPDCSVSPAGLASLLPETAAEPLDTERTTSVAGVPAPDMQPAPAAVTSDRPAGVPSS